MELKPVAGAERIHRRLYLSGVVVEPGAATAPAARGAVEKHRFVSENQESRISAVADDETSAIRQPTRIPWNVAACVAPARSVRGERIQFGKIHLLILGEGPDWQTFARANMLLRIRRENLRGLDVRRDLRVEKPDGDIRVRDVLGRHEPDRTDSAVLADEEESRLGGARGKCLAKTMCRLLMSVPARLAPPCEFQGLAHEKSMPRAQKRGFGRNSPCSAPTG